MNYNCDIKLRFPHFSSTFRPQYFYQAKKNMTFIEKKNQTLINYQTLINSQGQDDEFKGCDVFLNRFGMHNFPD